ncbi:MAG: pilus assembly protein PilM [Candidatus Pacebacteria bacterium]|nr:pilus assembly protein PilM [Candidatus Paceibacterota bacterium]
MWILNKKKQISSLGIDIGSKGIKIVELLKEKDRVVLQNYGGLKVCNVKKDSFYYFDKRTLLPSLRNVSSAIKAILEEAKIKTKEAVFSLPDFATFFTTFTLPPMTKSELAEAVNFEAKKHIPIPLNEVVLDWELIGGTVNEKEGENKILIMAISKALISGYKKIAENCGLTLLSLEAEVMGLKRAVIAKTEGNICLVETGSQSTTISIISNGYLIMSVSFDVAGKDCTYSIAEALSIDLGEAEKIKMNSGLKNRDKKVVDAISPIIAIILDKVKNVISDFELKNGKVTKIVLSGGLSNMAGLLDYFRNNFKDLEVKNSNAFENIFYPPELKEMLPEIESTFSIALGEALKKFED